MLPPQPHLLLLPTCHTLIKNESLGSPLGRAWLATLYQGHLGRKEWAEGAEAEDHGFVSLIINGIRANSTKSSNQLKKIQALPGETQTEERKNKTWWIIFMYLITYKNCCSVERVQIIYSFLFYSSIITKDRFIFGSSCSPKCHID